MRNAWQLASLVGGLLLMGVALTMMVFSSVNGQNGAESEVVSRPERAGALQEYRDTTLGVSLLYPAAWAPVEMGTGVAIRPGNAGDSVTSAPVFVIADTLDSLPGMPDSAEMSRDAHRFSENVLVDSVSGTERVFDVDRSDLSSSGSHLAAALDTSFGKGVTIVLWQGEREGKAIWVILADEANGANLATLQEIRNSIRWD